MGARGGAAPAGVRTAALTSRGYCHIIDRREASRVSEEDEQQTLDEPVSEIGSTHEHQHGTSNDPSRSAGRRVSVDHVPTGVPERIAGRDVETQQGQGTDRQPARSGELSGTDFDTEQLALALQHTSSWSAPMPDPDTLRQYEDVLPGLANRIMRAYEAATVDASRRDDKIVESNTHLAKAGLAVAMIIILVCLAASIVFFGIGNNDAGVALLAAPLAASLIAVLPRLFQRNPSVNENDVNPS